MNLYIDSLTNPTRLDVTEVKIGTVVMGAAHPIRLQSMTNTNTLDTNSTVEQCLKIFEAGADFVRITAPSMKEAENIVKIRKQLSDLGYPIPIIADVHFNPLVAEFIAKYIQKVRINPGNYCDKPKTTIKNLTFEEYQQELDSIESRLKPLLEICKKNNTAIRIGTNHGSLSERIKNKYGDTPIGMAESTMEFLRICKKNEFFNVVVSLKASNAMIMVQSCRLLVEFMKKENFLVPIHLGVTEAGDGEDGRIKSAVGIGALLTDGIGDTIRVSLSESPENEVPIAKVIVEHYKLEQYPILPEILELFYNPYEFRKRYSCCIDNVGGDKHPVVISDISGVSIIEESHLHNLGFRLNASKNIWIPSDLSPDYIYVGNCTLNLASHQNLKIIKSFSGTAPSEFFELLSVADFTTSYSVLPSIFFLELNYQDLNSDMLFRLKKTKGAIIIVNPITKNFTGELRCFFYKLHQNQIDLPVIIKKTFFEKIDEFQIRAACDFGSIMLDGFGDGIFFSSNSYYEQPKLSTTAFSILQSCRQRFTKTEFISCPTCGRTQFDMLKVLAEIKKRTSHLKGLKIAIMGCIVNGPGEMADADYGYIGMGKGKVTLFYKQKVVKNNINEESAIDELINLIKNSGDWIQNGQ